MLRGSAEGGETMSLCHPSPRTVCAYMNQSLNKRQKRSWEQRVEPKGHPEPWSHAPFHLPSLTLRILNPPLDHSHFPEGWETWV